MVGSVPATVDTSSVCVPLLPPSFCFLSASDAAAAGFLVPELSFLDVSVSVSASVPVSVSESLLVDASALSTDGPLPVGSPFVLSPASELSVD